MPHPLVSIIITSYNYAAYLRAAIDSALAQTYPNAEVIVLDDGSKDESPDIIRSYGDRITARLKTNEGPASSWNLGFALSRGQVIVFLDSDDVLMPGAVAGAVPLLTNDPATVRVQWPLWQIGRDGARTGGVIPGYDLAEGSFADALYRNGPASYVSSPTSGNAWSRAFIEQVLPVPDEFKFMCDAYLMTLSPLHGTVRAIREPQAYYRTHGANDYHGMSFLPRLRRDIKTFESRCALLAAQAARRGIAVDAAGWKRDSWFYRLDNAVTQIQRHVPAGDAFVMVDNGSWSLDQSIGRVPLPFLEKDGYYFGNPNDGPHAVAELERMRAGGATFLAIGYPAFWFADHYPEFDARLRSEYRRVAEDADVILYDLRK